MLTQQEQLDRARDIRTPEEFDRTYKNGMRREGLAIQALKEFHSSFGLEIDYRKIDEEELQNDTYVPRVGKFFLVQPDYWYFTDDQTITYEIKTSKTFDKIIPVKIYSIKTMLRYPDNYPNGKVLFANQTRFAILPIKKMIKKYPVKKTKILGGKLAYQVVYEDLKWYNWLVPINEW